jgi:hypothetical protein
MKFRNPVFVLIFTMCSAVVKGHLFDNKGERNRSCPTGRVARFFLVQTYQNGKKYTKGPQTIPEIIPNGLKIFQIFIKYNSIFHSKALQNVTKVGFLVENKPSGNPVSETDF